MINKKTVTNNLGKVHYYKINSLVEYYIGDKRAISENYVVHMPQRKVFLFDKQLYSSKLFVKPIYFYSFVTK